MDAIMWKTAVDFVLGENPTPGGGGTGGIAQTGDALSIVLLFLFGLIAIGSLAFFAYSRRKASETYGNYLDSAKAVFKPLSGKVIITAFLISIIAFLSVLFMPTINRAIADDNAADETIKAYVDLDAGTVTCDAASITNTSSGDVFISATQVDLTEEAKEILGDTKFKLKIHSDNIETTLYNKEVPGVEDQVKSLPYVKNQTIKATLEFSELDFAIAKLLIGKQVLNITFAQTPCYSVTYNSNGATSGKTPSPQIKEHGQTINLASKPDLVKDGYTLKNYWSTTASDDSSSTHYDFGTEYSADASITLYAA